MFKKLESKFLYDPLFKRLLENEFWTDLHYIIKLQLIDSDEEDESDLGYLLKPLRSKLNRYEIEKTDNTKEFLLNFYRRKYKPGGKCPSELFDNISKNLKIEYRIVHNTICSLLYP